MNAPQDSAGPSESSPVLPPSAALRTRAWAGLVAAGCVGVLAIAAWLEPDPRGFGTHQKLGASPCGMLILTGLPCPTCGMTTAFAHTVRGQWFRAFWAQPTGFLLALGTLGGAIGAIWVLLRGRLPSVRIPLLSPYRLFLGLLVFLIGGWAFKMAAGLWTGTLPLR